jgi:hypothetical protein
MYAVRSGSVVLLVDGVPVETVGPGGLARRLRETNRLIRS